MKKQLKCNSIIKSAYRDWFLTVIQPKWFQPFEKKIIGIKELKKKRDKKGSDIMRERKKRNN